MGAKPDQTSLSVRNAKVSALDSFIGSEEFDLVNVKNSEDVITEWECNFIGSLKDQLHKGKALTAKQIIHLDSIWNKATNSFDLDYAQFLS